MSKRRATAKHSNGPGFRSRPAWIAVIGWWSAVVLAIVATVLLNSWLADETRIGAQRAGIWLAGFAALAAITGWVGSIGSVLKDDGRVRAGASCLLAIPIVSLVMGIIAVSSTVERPTDPLPVLWVIISGLLLLVGTLLIVLPEHLGTS